MKINTFGRQFDCEVGMQQSLYGYKKYQPIRKRVSTTIKL